MINNHHLQYFADAIKNKSLTKAAKNNHVSVAAVSQAIKSIEDYVQIKIITHQRNRLDLTPEGALFYERTQKFLDQVNQFHEDVDFSSKSASGKINFATQQSFASVILPDLLLHTRKNLPDIKAHFKMGTTNYVKYWVESGGVDFGIALDNVSFKNCTHSLLFKGKFVCIKKKGTRGNLGFLTTDDTKEVKEFRKTYRSHFEKELKTEMVIGSWGVIAKMALKGVGIAFIPDYYLWDIPKEEYAICRMPFELPTYEVNAYTLKTKNQSSQSTLFLKELADSVERIKKNSLKK